VSSGKAFTEKKAMTIFTVFPGSAEAQKTDRHPLMAVELWLTQNHHKHHHFEMP